MKKIWKSKRRNENESLEAEGLSEIELLLLNGMNMDETEG